MSTYEPAAAGRLSRRTQAHLSILRPVYSVAVSVQSVRDAYSSMSEQYIALFDGGWQAHVGDTALVGATSPAWMARCSISVAAPGTGPPTCIRSAST